MNEITATGRGLFITLEGGEGAGKTTQLAFIRDWFEHRGHTVQVTRQPGGTPLSERIRELLLDPAQGDMTPLAELLLLFADRAQFLADVVRPALARGEVVLCDRFTDSTRAYQGGGRGMAADTIETLARLVHGDVEPDLTLLLDLPVETGMARAGARGEADRMESAGMAFHEAVRRAYRDLAKGEPERVKLIDASASAAEVSRAINEILEQIHV
ncbi:dTMP kinase [Marinihelvus fidelis]|uniref:Thymidylate kinase n=1 Tax=Marinihelvus fidelis TaxID=2613842 RepID=A0A5N0TBF5_9GAMM|nr:dTMP kinase [Marinihelvus fidelis]KAA9132008.1 dTMP kinase [Marinihelvus fidelis]